MAAAGAAMLIVPRASRAIFRYGLGVRLPEGRYERIAAWLLVLMGLAVMVVGRVVR